MPASIRRANTNTTDYEQYARHADQHFSIRIDPVSGTGGADNAYARPETKDKLLRGFLKAVALIYTNTHALFPRWRTGSQSFYESHICTPWTQQAIPYTSFYQDNYQPRLISNPVHLLTMTASDGFPSATVFAQPLSIGGNGGTESTECKTDTGLLVEELGAWYSDQALQAIQVTYIDDSVGLVYGTFQKAYSEMTFAPNETVTKASLWVEGVRKRAGHI